MFFFAAVKFPQTTTQFSSLRPPNMTLQTDPKIHQTISNQNQRLKSNETKPEDIHLYYLTHTRKLNYTHDWKTTRESFVLWVSWNLEDKSLRLFSIFFFFQNIEFLSNSRESFNLCFHSVFGEFLWAYLELFLGLKFYTLCESSWNLDDIVCFS
jgi:hypothetical protein